jgi:hypothetical protein
MTDQNNPNQGNDNPNEPPPPEVVVIHPREVEKGDTSGDLEK